MKALIDTCLAIDFLQKRKLFAESAIPVYTPDEFLKVTGSKDEENDGE